MEVSELREELADCFAWIGALANLYEVYLEAALLKEPYFRLSTHLDFIR